MVHSYSGWTRGVQVKLWDPLKTRAIPERLRGAFTTRRYTTPRLPLPLLSNWDKLVTSLSSFACAYCVTIIFLWYNKDRLIDWLMKV